MTGFNDVFGSQDSYLEKVVILPFKVYSNATNALNCPVGYSWADFEDIEFHFVTYNYGLTEAGGQTFNLTKEQIAANPSSWHATYSIQSGIQAQIQANGSTSGTVTTAGSSQVRYVVGFIRRYATENQTKVVQLTAQNTTGGTFTGGGKINKNQRYELDIATVLGADYVGKDLIVNVEIFHPTDSKWGKAGWYDGDGGTSAEGVRVSPYGDSIVVQSGVYAVKGAVGSTTGSPFTGGRLFEALCRIKVWKVERYAINTAGPGGGGITVLYDGAIITNGQLCTLSDAMSKYDDIRVYWTQGASMQYTASVTMEPSEVLRSGVSEVLACSLQTHTGANSFWGYVDRSDSNDTRLRVRSAQQNWSGGGIYRVIGIKYSS